MVKAGILWATVLLFSAMATAQQAVEADDCNLAATKPKVVKQVDPDWSEKARKKHIQGDVSVEITIGKNGSIEAAKVEKHLGYGLDEEVVKAVLKWVFTPALNEKQEPIACRSKVFVSFNLY